MSTAQPCCLQSVVALGLTKQDCGLVAILTLQSASRAYLICLKCRRARGTGSASASHSTLCTCRDHLWPWAHMSIRSRWATLLQTRSGPSVLLPPGLSATTYTCLPARAPSRFASSLSGLTVACAGALPRTHNRLIAAPRRCTRSRVGLASRTSTRIRASPPPRSSWSRFTVGGARQWAPILAPHRMAFGAPGANADRHPARARVGQSRSPS